MPSISVLTNSRFLKKEDVGGGIVVLIQGVVPGSVGTEDEPKDGWIMNLTEPSGQPIKPLVINKTNAEIIAEILGSEEMDDWVGQQICLYNDPNVIFKGKRTGGIRVRAVPVQNYRPQVAVPQRPTQPLVQHQRPAHQPAPAYRPPAPAPEQESFETAFPEGPVNP